ncbi:unnamed protein product, partial [Choristocarpus tenellus]
MLEILRWMRRLGVKVDSSLMTVEPLRCHKRLSDGTLLSELVAALDYAISGGRGLEVRELSTSPGRFVLKGTC